MKIRANLRKQRPVLAAVQNRTSSTRGPRPGSLGGLNRYERL